MFICIIALLFGICLALFVPLVIPSCFIPVFGIIVMDILLFTVLAVNAKLNKRLNMKIFISGFVITVFAVVGSMYIGSKLDLDIYPAFVLLFGAAVFKGCFDIFNFYAGKKNNG